MTTTAEFTLAHLRAEARLRWGTSTPYRLGTLVGARGLSIANPYPNPRGSKCYADGVANGKESRESIT